LNIPQEFVDKISNDHKNISSTYITYCFAKIFNLDRQSK